MRRMQEIWVVQEVCMVRRCGWFRGCGWRGGTGGVKAGMALTARVAELERFSEPVAAGRRTMDGAFRSTRGDPWRSEGRDMTLEPAAEEVWRLLDLIAPDVRAVAEAEPRAEGFGPDEPEGPSASDRPDGPTGCAPRCSPPSATTCAPRSPRPRPRSRA
ncbi:hypothetical protein GCM10009733_082440 [Nonomuraea maheshkhaliensis]|uniref:Uncharacterized protein n=1 Tax=Nonomuraea maheshkhaliensis TaxID=419590 RepID=A0ABP4SNH8_9ACTN